MNLNPGVYILSPSNNPPYVLDVTGGTVTGAGVMFYNTGGSFVASTGSPDYGDAGLYATGPSGTNAPPSDEGFQADFAGIRLDGSTNANITLSALSDSGDPFSGMLIYQRRANMQAIEITGGNLSLSGTIYACGRRWSFREGGPIRPSSLSGSMQLSGSDTLTLSNRRAVRKGESSFFGRIGYEYPAVTIIAPGEPKGLNMAAYQPRRSRSRDRIRKCLESRRGNAPGLRMESGRCPSPIPRRPPRSVSARFPTGRVPVKNLLASSLNHAPRFPIKLSKRFGRYRIIKRLGRGAMGSVYLAHDTHLDRRVALKVPHFRTEGDASEPNRLDVDRFHREARIAATFDHPNLCPVYDVGQIDGVHYLSMAYIKGRPLSDYIDPQKPMPPQRVAAVIRKLALALAVAHGRGVVHRDLKPSNIMVNSRRELIIMDFGLAWRLGSSDERLTKTGMVLGTPAYMSPEQLSGNAEALGPRCDIYSLGVIMYELLTACRPFSGQEAVILGQILFIEPAPPSGHRPDLDAQIEAICLKAMAKRPEERYATMDELADSAGRLRPSLRSAAPCLRPQSPGAEGSGTESARGAGRPGG